MEFHFWGKTVDVNVANRTALRQKVLQRLRTRTGFSLATINLDHLVKMAASPSFVKTYQAQDLVVADGHPIVWLSQIARRPVQRMPGSDMVQPLCEWAASADVPVAFVGSTTEALEDAKRVLSQRVPGLRVTWTHAPGKLDPEGEEAARILQELETRQIGLCFLALGAPKQERIAQRGRGLAPSVGFASVGAGLDFLGSHQKRAPQWVRNLALEWLWRALSNPLRLGPRYIKCLAILPQQLWRALELRNEQAAIYIQGSHDRGRADD